MISATVASATEVNSARIAVATTAGIADVSAATTHLDSVRREQNLPFDSRRRHRYLCPGLDNALCMALLSPTRPAPATVPRPSPARRRVALRDRVLRLAELVTTPLL